MTTYSFYAIEETFRVPDEGAIIAVRPTEVTLTFDNNATALGFRTDLDRSEYDGNFLGGRKEKPNYDVRFCRAFEGLANLAWG